MFGIDVRRPVAPLVAAFVLLALSATPARAGFAYEPIEVDAPLLEVVDATLGDLDGDGDADLTVLAAPPQGGGAGLPAALVTFIRAADGTLTQTGRSDVREATPAGHLELADFDDDGTLDAFVTAQGYGGNGRPTTVMLGDGAGGFAAPAQELGSEGRAAFADFDGDGALDIAGVRTQDIVLYLGNGDGTFGAPQRSEVRTVDEGLVSGDFDGDGDPDLLAHQRAHPNDATPAQIVRNDDGVLVAAGQVDSTQMAAGELDGAAGDDIVGVSHLSQFGFGGVISRAGAGDLAFPELSTITTRRDLERAPVTLGELGDGPGLDLVFHTPGRAGTFSAYAGGGDGSFSELPDSGVQLHGKRDENFVLRPAFLRVGDVSGDGRGDVYTAGVGLKLDVYRRTAPPTARLTHAPDFAHNGDEVTFDASGSSAAFGTLSYRFDLDADPDFEVDNGTSPTLTRSFAQAGVHTVRVKVSTGDPREDAIATDSVETDAPFSTSFAPEPSYPVPADVPVDITASGGFAPYTHKIEHGLVGGTVTTIDPATSSQTLRFTDPGTYRIKVTTTDRRGQQETDTHDVRVANPVVARLTAPANAQPGETVRVSALSGPAAGGIPPLRYEFDLDGDGSYETDNGTSEAETSFATAGEYRIRVRVTDSTGESAVDAQPIGIGVPLQARLETRLETPAADHTVPKAGERIVLDARDTSGGDGELSFEFDADGLPGYEVGPGAARSVTTSFAANGDYEVGVRVTDQATPTPQVEEQRLPVQVRDRLVAGYDVDPSVVRPGEAATFTATVTGGVEPWRYEWTFGDGETSTAGPTVTHAYTELDRTYATGLKVTDAAGQVFVAPAKEVDVADTFTAALTISPTDPIVGDPVTFDASGSSGGVLPRAYAFDLDTNPDFERVTGAQSTTTKAFDSPGEKQVRVRVSDRRGRTRVTGDTVVVGPELVPSFTVTPDLARPNTDVVLDASASHGGVGALSYAYDIGDGTFVDNGADPKRTVRYPTVGRRTITLRVTDSQRHVRTTQRPVEVAEAPAAGVTVSPNPVMRGTQVAVRGSVSGGVSPYRFRFDIGDDGSFDREGSTAFDLDTTNLSGSVPIRFRVDDARGQTGTAVTTLTVNDGIAAALDVTPDLARPGQTVTLDAGRSSGGGTRRYHFDVDGDGFTYEVDNGTSPVLTTSYPTEGSRNVGVQVSSVTFPTAMVSNARANLDVSTPPTARLGFSPERPFAGDAVTLDAGGSTGGLGGYAYAFDLDGNGTYETDARQSPTTTFTPSGASTRVGVRVTDRRGQAGTATAEFETPARISPQFAVAPAVRDTGTELTLDATATTGGLKPYRYAWDLDNDGRFDNVAADPASPRLTGVKLPAGQPKVGLQVTDRRGSSQTVVTDVPMASPLTARLNAPDVVEAPAAFEATAVGGGGRAPYTYAFAADGKAVEGPATQATRSLTLAPGPHTIAARVTDADGRTEATSRTVTVDARFTPAITYSPEAPEPNDTITFDSAATTGGLAPYRNHVWRFDGSGDQFKPQASFAFATEGDHQVSLQVMDARGRARSVQQTVTVVPACTREVAFKLTQVKTSGCLKKRVDRDKKLTYYETSDAVKLNGLAITPPGDTKLRFTLPGGGAPGGKVGGRGVVRFNGDRLFEGGLDFDLPAGDEGDQGQLATLKIPGSGFSIKGFRVGGGAGIKLGRKTKAQGGDYYSVVDLNVALPNVFRQGPEKGDGGVTGDAAIVVDERGPNLDGVKIQVKNAWMGRLQVENACFSYVAANSKSAGACKVPELDGQPVIACRSQADAERWDGSAVVVLPTASKPKLGAYGGTTNGQLAYFGGFADNLGHTIQVAPNVWLNRIGIGVCLNPPPLTVKGDVGVTALPGANGDILKVNGYFQYTDAFTYRGFEIPWSVEVGGRVYVLDKKIAEGSVKFQSTGAVDFGITAGIRFPEDPDDTRVASVEGFVNGWVEPARNAFNVHGGLKACIGPWEIGCAGAEAAFSNTGMGACMGAAGARLGFGHKWKDEGVDMLGGACDLGPYQTKRTRQLLDGALHTFALPAGQPAVALRVHGATAPPQVLLTAPDGAQFASPAAGGPSVDFERLVIVEDAATNTTHVWIPNPVAGQWRLAAQPGSAPIAAVDQATAVPQAKVTARVVKQGRRYRLRTRYTLAPTDTMTFVEKGDKAQQTIGVASAKLCGGSATELCDDLPFTPQFGPAGTRKLLAIVTRDGVPVDQFEIGSYEAPTLSRPARVEKMRLVRVGRSVIVAWRKARIDGHYQAVVRTGDGAAKVHLPKPGCSALRIRGVRRGTSVRASVFGIRRDLVAGPHAVIRLDGGKGFRSHWPQLRKQLHISRRCA